MFLYFILGVFTAVILQAMGLYTPVMIIVFAIVGIKIVKSILKEKSDDYLNEDYIA